MKDTSEQNLPDFNDYGIVIEVKGDGGFLKDIDFERKCMYLFFAEKKDRIRAPIRRGRRPKQFGWIDKWYDKCLKKRSKELFERYYVEGHDSFCLAVAVENREGLPLYKFLLPKYLVKTPFEKFTKEEANSLVDNSFENLIHSIRGSSGNKCMAKGKFLAFIGRIRKIAEIHEENKTIKYDECKRLNQLCKQLPKDRDITSDFLQSILNSLTEDLLQNKVILQCEFCGDFFKYIRGKKYCSFKSEGKGCGKKARNKRYYEKHKSEILPKARKSTKELRAFYKKMGVKK